MTVSHALRNDLIDGLRASRETNTPITPDLRDAMLEYLVRDAGHAQRIKERDHLICDAGNLLPEGTNYVRARTLQREARAMLRTWHVLRSQAPRITHPTVRDLLHAAALKANLPGCARQFNRILDEALTDIRGVAMSAESRKDSSIHNQEERSSEY